MANVLARLFGIDSACRGAGEVIGLALVGVASGFVFDAHAG